MAEQQLTNQQRMELFTQSTRQYEQAQASVYGQAGDTLTFDLVKTRLSSHVLLLVEYTVKAIHATNTTFKPAATAPFNVFSNIRMDINTGFAPFVVTGEQLYHYNELRSDSFINDVQSANPRSQSVFPNAASAAGVENKVTTIMSLPLTINEREPVGLIMTQNTATTVTVQMNVAINPTVFLDAGQSGYTLELKDVKVTPVVQSFSIPLNPMFMPPLQVIKQVHASTMEFNANTVSDLRLVPGYTFRKIIIKLTDENGVGLTDDQVSGNIELVLNQSDFPYRIPAKVLARKNQMMYGKTLPQGVYVFDFTYQGLANYGGNRDYIDTARLTEFWVRFNPAVKGRAQAIYETLAFAQ